MRLTHGARGLVVAAMAATALAACSSSVSPSGPSDARHSATTPADTVTTAASPAGVHTTPQIQAAVEHAYHVFFSSRSTTPETERYLQQGKLFVPTLRAQAKNPMSNTSSVRASDVVLVTPHTASVRYTVLVSGHAMLGNQAGFAVLEGGRWKVAGRTFCALMALQNTHPSACKDAAAVALPH